MGAITAAGRAVDTLKRNPVIFLGALFLGLLSLPSYVLQTEQVPLIATAWAGVAFFISPFLTGGLIGMAAEGLQGRTSLGRFVAAGRSNYVHLLLVAILLLVVIGVFAGLGAVALVAIFAFGISATGGVSAGTGTLVVVGGLVLLYLLVLVALSLLLQFVYQAVVVDDVGPVAAFKQSYRTVRENLVGAIGVGLIALLLSGVLSGVPVAAATLAVQPSPTAFDVPISETAAYAIIYGWGMVSTVVFGAFNNTMLVAFYDAYAPAPR